MQISIDTATFLQSVECNNCEQYTFNNGLPAPCLDWTVSDSNIIREKFLKDNELMDSGLVRRIDGSTLGNKRKIQSNKLNVGFMRSRANGVGAMNECKITYNGVTTKEFQKEFYIVPYELNPRLCPKNWIGTKWQNVIGSMFSTFSNPEALRQSTLGELLLMLVMEEFKRSMPQIFLLGVDDGADARAHGDDGILAKAYYAHKKQYFHSVTYQLVENEQISAIIGGNRYDKLATEFASFDQYVLDFVEWLNSKRDTQKRRLVSASINLDTFVLSVVANIATVNIREDLAFRIISADSPAFVDWGCTETLASELPYTEYVRPQIINDVPLLWQYEAIDETNFLQYFKNRLKEMKIYLANNYDYQYNDADLRIAIDPMLMLEMEAWQQNKIIECCEPNTGNTALQIGLSRQRFIPMTALQNTGLFFITVNGNLLLFTDGSDPTALAKFSFEKIHCADGSREMALITELPPFGSSVEYFGAFGSNLLNSPFVLNNNLDEKEPSKFAKLQVACYDQDVLKECVVEAACYLDTTTTVTATYDDVADVTNVLVDVDVTGAEGGTLDYSINYAVSDGTSNGGTPIATDNFTFQLQGDQTNSGLIVNVFGTVENTLVSGGTCNAQIIKSVTLGSGTPQTLCLEGTNDQASNILEATLRLDYIVAGQSQSVLFVDPALTLDTTDQAIFDQIADEIEVILGSGIATVTRAADIITIQLDGIDSNLTDIQLISDDNNNTMDIQTPCA